MADAETAGEADRPHHRLLIHQRAKRRLNRLRGAYDVDGFEACLDELKFEREPRHHGAADGLEGFEGFRVRVGTLRAIGVCQPPWLLVLAVGIRRGFYDRKLGVAKRRLDDWDGGEASDV